MEVVVAAVLQHDGGQVVPATGFLALLVAQLHLLASAAAVFVHTATDGATNFALQGNAFGLGLVGATHARIHGRERFGISRRQGFAFGPVKRHAKRGATSATMGADVFCGR